MPIRKVIIGDQASLRQVSSPVTEFNPELKQLAADMVDTMRDYDGVGLAAPQVGALQRLIVIESAPIEDIPDNPVFPLKILVNPSYEQLSPTQAEGIEGCLSLPRWYGPVNRFTKIRVTAQDLDGNPVKFDAKDFEARVIQHEVDHLNGVLFTDLVTDPTKLRKRVPRDE